MPFEISCDCGQILEVSEEWIGMEAECPSCNKSIVIPGPDTPVEAVEGVALAPEPAVETEQIQEQTVETIDVEEAAAPEEQKISVKRDVPQPSGPSALNENFTGGYYKHSGKMPIPGLIVGLVAGVISAAVLGSVYGLLIYYIPFIYLNAILAVGCGLGTGFATAFGLKIGKVRNNAVIAVISLFFGLMANYVAWITWFAWHSEGKKLVIDPISMFREIMALSSHPVWSMGSSADPAFMYLLIWVLEILLVAGGAVFAAYAFLFHRPFCEICECWIDDKITIAPLTKMQSPAIITKELEAGNFMVLKELHKLPGTPAESSKLELCHCKSCQDLYILTLKSVTVTFEDNKEQVNESKVVNNLLINGAIYQELQQTWQGTA